MSSHHHHRSCEKKEECVVNSKLANLVREDQKVEAVHFTPEEALYIANCLGINFETAPFDLEQFRMGLDVELEHGLANPYTNVTGNDPILTGKIALAHLNEFPDYYTRLAKMEAEAKKYWKRKKAH